MGRAPLEAAQSVVTNYGFTKEGRVLQQPQTAADAWKDVAVLSADPASNARERRYYSLGLDGVVQLQWTGTAGGFVEVRVRCASLMARLSALALVGLGAEFGRNRCTAG